MKKRILLLAISFLPFFSSYSQTIENNAELGEDNLMEAQCWEMRGLSVSDRSSTLISGKYSFRTNELSNASLSASWLKTPWLKFKSGNITFKTKLDGSAGGNRSIVFQYIALDKGRRYSSEEDPVEFHTYNFPHPINKNEKVYAISVPVPQGLVDGKFYKVLFSFVGTGGSARAGMDELVLPGTYSSDPSKRCRPMETEKDADGDGVPDTEDEFPDDPFKAFNNYFPAKGFGTLMFEDLWPGIGDYDFNDLVVDYRINRITDVKNEIVQAVIELKTRAIGAGFKNGFGIELTHLDPNKVLNVVGTNLSNSSIHKIANNGLEEGTKWVTVIAYDNAMNVLPYAGGGVTGVNTETDAPKQKIETQVIVITFKIKGEASPQGAVHLKELELDNFNPFLIRNQERKVEIHLPGKPATALADMDIFGTMDDNSDLKGGILYQSKEYNLPWALHFSESIPYMIEKENFTFGYIKFKDWVISNGISHQDWYLDLPGYRNSKVIY